MRPIVTSNSDGDEESAALVAELSRLEREIQAVGQHIDRLEAEMWQSLNGVALERFEEYR